MRKTIEQKLIDRYESDLCRKIVLADFSDGELAMIANGGSKTRKLQNFFGGTMTIMIKNFFGGMAVFALATLIAVGWYINQV